MWEDWKKPTSIGLVVAVVVGGLIAYLATRSREALATIPIGLFVVAGWVWTRDTGTDFQAESEKKRERDEPGSGGLHGGGGF